MKIGRLIFVVVFPFTLVFAEDKTFEEILKNDLQKSENFHDFKKLDEENGTSGNSAYYNAVRADLRGACVFMQTTSPGIGTTPAKGIKVFVVEDYKDVLKACEEIPNDSCEGGVALDGHAHYNMGTWNILYLDSSSSVENPSYYPSEKTEREKLVACFKRISKGVREGTIPLHFNSCTHPYPEDPKKWDKFSHLLSKDLGLRIRTSRGDAWSSSGKTYGLAHYGWSWSTPQDPQVRCEDGKNCRFDVTRANGTHR